MQYFGGKARIAKFIVPFLENVRKEGQVFLEPFVGGANIVSQMTGERIACDYNEYLIELYRNVQQGYELPDELNEEQYQHIKNNKDNDKCITGFVGFGCSFAGKWFGGYARNKQNHNYCKASKKSLLKKMGTMQNVKFEWKDYKTLNPKGMLIYCDPPYKDTTKYTGVPDFDSNEFWDVMRKWSEDNDVYISEYDAPEDFQCVLEMPTKTSIRDKTNNVCDRIEKLFTIKKQREVKEMELKVKEVTLPEQITFNYEELKQELTAKVEMYTNLVYTDEQIQDAKKDKANLNKLKKALNDERIRLEKKYMQPFNQFKAQINEIIGIIDKPVAVINKQVEEYEEKQKQDKKEQIEFYFAEYIELPENEKLTWLKLPMLFNEKWLNASIRIKAIQDEIKARVEQIHKDILSLSNLPEFSFEATEVYKSTLDLGKALNEASRLAEIARKKAEYEAQQKAREEEQARKVAEAEAKKQEEPVLTNINDPSDIENVAPIKPVEEVPAKQWISFSALLSTEDALALKAFFEGRQIEFKAI